MWSLRDMLMLHSCERRDAMYATTQLRNEHEGILVILAVLEQIAETSQHGQVVDLADLDAILDFLRTFADRCHHGKEEDFLFPALVAMGLPAEGGPIGVMLAEHAQGRAYIREMGEALARLHAGEDGISLFATSALGYAELLRAHIAKENQILFMMAEHNLAPHIHEQLGQAFERIEEERIGAGAHERYHTLIHALQDKYLKTAA
jgi:hemerythrin-like domain-containing protein